MGMRIGGDRRGTAAVVRAAAVVLAAAVLAGCTTPPAAEPSSPATAEPAPTPTLEETPEPLDAVPAFDGSCDRILGDDEAIVLIGDLDAPPMPPVFAVDVDSADGSVRLAGGLSCSWTASDYASFGVSAFPLSLVPADTAQPTETMCAEFDGFCERTLVLGSTWVQVTSGWGQSLVDQVAAIIESRDPGEPRAADPLPAWGSLAGCGDIEEAVLSVLGEDAQRGFPTDTHSSGTGGAILGAAGLFYDCPWYAYTPTGEIPAAAVDIHPGIGAPDPELLAEWGAEPIEVAGATNAHAVVDDRHGHRIIVAVGDHRLNVEGLPGGSAEQLAAVAASVLTALGD